MARLSRFVRIRRIRSFFRVYSAILIFLPVALFVPLFFVIQRDAAVNNRLHDLERDLGVRVHAVQTLVAQDVSRLRQLAGLPLFTRAAPEHVGRYLEEVLRVSDFLGLALVARDGTLLAGAGENVRLPWLAAGVRERPVATMVPETSQTSGPRLVLGVEAVFGEGGTPAMLLAALDPCGILSAVEPPAEAGQVRLHMLAPGLNYAHNCLTPTGRSPLPQIARGTGTSDGFYVNHQGRRVLGVAAAWLDEQLVLGLEVPRESVMAQVYRILGVFALCVAVAVPIAAVAGIWLSRKIERPLETLAEASACVQADGKLECSVDFGAMRQAPRELKKLALAFNRMVASMAYHLELLEKASSTDPLTGLLNRRALMQETHKIIQRAMRSGRSCCCLMIDLDHFKEVNDTHGHMTGDTVLQQVAEIFRNQVRETDLLSRYGGEEFTVFAPDATLEDGMLLAERIRRAVEATVIRDQKVEIDITVSIGVARLREEITYGTNMAEDIYHRADEALYKAKQNGRNRTEAWDRGEESRG
jgi:diguanylate cyclase (GGDEF)-like protein